MDMIKSYDRYGGTGQQWICGNVTLKTVGGGCHGQFLEFPLLRWAVVGLSGVWDDARQLPVCSVLSYH
jgi:hypothetical protein